MSGLVPDWFIEDRANFKGDALKEEMEKTEKALRSSSVLARLLKNILERDIQKTYAVEESFEHPAYERKIVAAAAERKTLRRIIKLLP